MNKFRSASFWMSLSGAIIMLLTTLGVRVDAEYVNEILTAISTILVMLGILTAPTVNKTQEDSQVDETNGQDTITETEDI